MIIVMKIKLIEPSLYTENGRLLKSKRLLMPSLALPLLAALTPNNVDITIVNEQFEDIDFEEKVDLVGITSYTPQILRAYDIADEFRRRNVPVVMGGIHVSMEPQEAMEHADTVIVGEAEEMWPEFMRDFENGIRKNMYVAQNRPSLFNLPIPRFSLIDKLQYISFQNKGLYRFLPLPMIPIQTARGCPHSCDFCSVTIFSGTQYRTRPIPQVIDEIKMLRAKSCFFVDDNIFANPNRAKELFSHLVPLKILWIGQATISAAKDRELIMLARKSGCIALAVGLESLSTKILSSVSKTMNRVDEYEKNLTAYRKEGISVIISMVFGLDGENSMVFKEAYNFLLKNRIPYTFWWPITPFPGTSLLKRLKESDRLKDEKWWLNSALSGKKLLKFACIGIDEESFYKTFKHYYWKFYSLQSICKRILLPPQQRFFLKIILNLLLRKDIPIQHLLVKN